MRINSWQAISHIQAPEKNGIQLFRIDKRDVVDESQERTSFPLLSADELERFNRFRFAKDKYTYGVARFSLRLLCGLMLNEDPKKLMLAYNEFGKPYLRNFEHLQFNVSHSGDLILIGFSFEKPLGVDVERFKHHIDHMALVHSVFSSMEIETLEALDKQLVVQGFYNCWSKKESYIKAKGKGLQIPLSQFSVRIFDDGFNNLEEVHWDMSETSQWQLFNLDIQHDYAAACTCDRNVELVECYDINELISQHLS